MPKVSVILPTYNCAAYLHESIASVLGQTFKDLELIIVDDGSTDSTEEAVRKGFSDARVRYIRQTHSGLSKARNRGVSEAVGDFIAFIDADDIFLESKIAEQVRAFRKHPRASVVYTSEKYFYDDENDSLLESPYVKLSGDIFFFLKRSNFIHISTVMVKRDAAKEVSFDSTLKSHEDWDYFLKLASSGARFYYLPCPLSLIRVRPSSMTAATPVMDHSRKIVGERARELWKTFKKSVNMSSLRGLAALRRYAALRMRAKILKFPHGKRFNRPPHIRKGI